MANELILIVEDNNARPSLSPQYQTGAEIHRSREITFGDVTSAKSEA